MSKKQYDVVKLEVPFDNAFDLSHSRKLSCDLGQLVPILAEECLPGDKWRCQSDHLLRFAPMLAPMMHRVDVYMHFFKVPLRIMWAGYDEFFNSDGETFPAHPTVSISRSQTPLGGISDHLGFPNLPPSHNYQVSAFYHMAYWKIWYEYYRDQNLQVSQPDFMLADGDNTPAFNDRALLQECYYRAWEKDYFTSALPWPQKGPAATLPVATTANLLYSPSGVGSQVRDAATGNLTTGTHSLVEDDGILETDDLPSPGTALPSDMDVTNSHVVDLANALVISIETLRLTNKIQKYLELRARGGTRYSEYLKSVWNVFSSDARLQRPEYLGGSKTPVNVSEVLSTTAMPGAEDPQPLGQMGGHGLSVSNMNGFSTYCEEHCIVMGIMSVMPKPEYYQGLRRAFTRNHPFDYYQPPFANLGEQPLLVKELYAQAASPDDTFGYQAAWAEYKDIPSTVHGDFRSSLLFWHMAIEYGDAPALNEEFILATPDKGFNRVFAVETDVAHLWVHVIHKLRVSRKIPLFNVPDLA